MLCWYYHNDVFQGDLPGVTYCVSTITPLFLGVNSLTARMVLVLLPVLLFKLKYRFGHPENYVFSLAKKYFLDQSIKKKLFI